MSIMVVSFGTNAGMKLLKWKGNLFSDWPGIYMFKKKKKKNEKKKKK